MYSTNERQGEILQKLESVEERRKMLILLEDRLVKEALCVEIMQRSEKRDGTSFYNYESKEHFICKIMFKN